MLCPSCDEIRFPTDVNKRMTTVATTVIEKSRKPGKAGKTNSSKTEQSANRDVATVATVTCSRCETPCESVICCDICLYRFDNECSNLSPDVFAALRKIISQTGWVCQDCRTVCRTKMGHLQTAQAELAEKLMDTSVSLAYLQDEVEQLKARDNTDSPADNPTHTTSTRIHVSSAQENTVTVKRTVLNTLNDLERRKQNLIVTGIPESDDDDDTEQAECFFVKLCEEHLSIKPLPVHRSTKRLGTKSDGCDGSRPRRLLIRLQSKECVRVVLAAAKNLRGSEDEYVRHSVYINADLSPTEAKLAYERRQSRRERIARQQAMVTETTNSSSITTTITGTSSLGTSAKSDSTGLQRLDMVPINTGFDDSEIAFKLPFQPQPSTGSINASTTTAKQEAAVPLPIHSGDHTTNEQLFQ